MKRKIALLLSLVFLIVAVIPAQVFAAGADKELETALNIAKSKFVIPESLSEFNYSTYNQGAKKIWNLNWNSKNGMEGGINVSVDDKGNIINYSYYKPTDYSGQQKLPKISKKDALTVAEEFIKKVNPAVAGQIKLREENQNTYLGTEYYFNYIRVVNGIPFPDNTLSITVNNERSEVTSYYLNWTDNLALPDTSKAISPEAAQKAYKEKLGLRLQYNYYYDNNVVKLFPVYAPKYNSSYFIDALTGEKILLSPYYGIGGYGGGGMAFDNAKSESAMPAPQSLTPQELEAIADVSKVMSQAEAEEIIRGIKELELTSDFKVAGANLNRDWMFKQNFTWNIYFQKEATNTGKTDGGYVSASINAVTGEVKDFYRSFYYDGNQKPKYDFEASKAAVESFLKTFIPEKYKDIIYEEVPDYRIYREAAVEPQQQYSFQYIRKVNGVAFPGNSISVTYDAVNGKVTSFYSNWFDMAFPSVDKVLPEDQIYNNLFTDVGIELQYRLNYSEETTASTGEKMIIRPEEPKSIKLVYAVKSDKPATFDANTGVILDYNGQPYKEIKPAEYTDISGNFAESQITALAEYGISLEGTEFKPNETITQADFVRLISKTVNYYGPVYPANTTKELDDLYAFLTREGVIKAGEKAPDASVTKEEAIKFVIRALKYDKVADIQGIFLNPFKDSDQIAPDLTGYVAIAKGLKIVNGDENGFFSPKNKLTRAQAAVIIYNYLQK